MFQFLNTLDRKYDPIKKEILQWDPLPTAEAAYATVWKETAHQNIFVGTQQGVTSGVKLTDDLDGIGLVSKGRRSNQMFNSSSSQIDKTKLKCENCGMTKHTIEQCFEIVGYPDWWVGNKKEKSGKEAAAGEKEYNDALSWLKWMSSSEETSHTSLPQSTDPRNSTINDDPSILLSKKYVLDLLAETGMIDCKPMDTPMMVNQKLYIEEEAKLADKGRSTSGYFTIIGGNFVTWRSKKQKVVALSSAEAEFQGIAQGLAEAFWIRKLLSEIGYHSTQTSKIMCDNKAGIQISKNPVQHDRTKHIEVDRHFIKEKLENWIIELPFVRSKDQLTDILTKAQNRTKEVEARNILSLKGGQQPKSLLHDCGIVLNTPPYCKNLELEF
nr:putative copia-type protein [Tanacetum cinerariifolium]